MLTYNTLLYDPEAEVTPFYSRDRWLNNFPWLGQTYRRHLVEYIVNECGADPFDILHEEDYELFPNREAFITQYGRELADYLD